MKKSLKWKVAQTAEIGWWKVYLKKKNENEYAAWKKNYWNNLLEKIEDVAPVQNGMHVLDAGCGPAGVFMVTPQCKTDAVDPLLNKYEDKLPHFNKSFYPWTTFHSVPIEEFAPGKTYDLVFCMNAINHVSDLQLCFDKLISFTKPGGKIVLTIDAHNFSFFKYLFRLIPGDILHPHQYNLNEYKHLLEVRQCNVVKTLLLKKEFFFDHYLIVAKKQEVAFASKYLVLTPE